MKHLNTFTTVALVALVSFSLIAPAEAATRRSYGSTRTERNESSYSSRRLPSAAQRKANALAKEDPLAVIPIPILLGIEPKDFGDTWGDARSNGRTHEGTDILAPKNAYIVAPSESVVSDIGEGANGGNFVYTINPGGERYYFAHLDAYAEGLEVGDILEKGDLIGYVGNTGNASGGAPHLHFGIYAGGAQNPFARLSATFTTEERVEAIDKIISAADDEDAEARVVVGNHAAFFRSAQAQGIELPTEIKVALASTVITPVAQGGGIVGSRDLTLGSQGADVVKLQTALITQAKGPAAVALKTAGATGYFGGMTQSALAEFQSVVGISPASGYFGPLTRARFTSLGL